MSATPPPAPAPETELQSEIPLAVPSPAAAPLDLSLRRLDAFLTVAGFPRRAIPPPSGDDSPVLLSLVAPAAALAVLGLALPAAAFALSRCRKPGDGECEVYQVEVFEICVLLSNAAAAGIALACVGRSIAKNGLRMFVFVDEQHGRENRFQKEYARRIKLFFRLVACWISPCFMVKAAREGFRSVHLFRSSRWRALFVFFASMASWIYLTTIILSSCALFSLVCNLQVIHYDDFSKLLEQDCEPLIYLKEHLFLRQNLARISHKFRMFLLLLFCIVTASQFAILIQTTGYGGTINFTNGGDLAVSSVVQVVGLIICLHGATKISHRAQNIAAVAARWHALVTCSTDSTMSPAGSSGDLLAFPASRFLRELSTSDLDSPPPSDARLASYMSSYHKRQALVQYLQSNPGGITIFGITVDRGLLNTILMLELTLALFVLGKTLVLPSRSPGSSFTFTRPSFPSIRFIWDGFAS